MFRNLVFVLAILLTLAGSLRADPPVAFYIFPAGGQRGKTVNFHVGGLFLHKSCGFEMLGPGVEASKQLQLTKTVWFEGPLLPLPDSQQAEDYPKDMAGSVQIAADAAVGVRHARVWTAQGATPSLKFMVGDLPEIVEEEIDGDPVPVAVQLPVTINGRIFPRENVDIWAFDARKGQTISCEVWAARLGSPLDSHLEVHDPQGRKIAENDDTFGADSFVRFTAASDGKYQVRIHDINNHGGQAYVYRLTFTADSYVDRAYPLGGRRGSKTAFELTGQGLPAGPMEIQLPAEGPRDHAHRLSIGGKLSNPFLLELDDLPEHLEAEPNDELAQVKPVAVPAVLNGRIDKPGDIDYWAFTARKGEVYELDLRASRLGSPLSAVLVLSDASGKELARQDNVAGPQPDPSLRFTVPADGTYFVRISDRFPTRGGPQYAYRLRIAPPPAANFRLQLAADVLPLPRGGQAKLKITAERLGGFPGPITLAIDGLPPGVTATGTAIGMNQAAAEITLKAETAAPIRGARLTIRGTAKVGDQTATRTAALPSVRGMPELDSVLLAVTLPTPFKVTADHDMRWAPRGSVHHRHYRIERGGFNGPLEISLADRQARHLQGVTGPTITVPPGVSEFDYSIHMPPWMETGRTCRVVVMATGVVKDADGSEHAVSFSSAKPDDQVIVVVEPGRLGVELDRGSISAVPGKTLSVPVRVSRGKSLRGLAKVELLTAAHIHGITSDRITVPPDQSSAILVIRFAPDLRGPFNSPLVVRATVMDKGEPVVAETKLELQPATR